MPRLSRLAELAIAGLRSDRAVFSTSPGRDHRIAGFPGLGLSLRIQPAR